MDKLQMAQTLNDKNTHNKEDLNRVNLLLESVIKESTF
jgi:hypothetical protein